jgi:hypothetical protein
MFLMRDKAYHYISILSLGFSRGAIQSKFEGGPIYHNSQHTWWDENLPSLTMGFNTAWHESTGATSALFFLGRELNHPLGLKREFSELDLQQSPPDTEVFGNRP